MTDSASYHCRVRDRRVLAASLRMGKAALAWTTLAAQHHGSQSGVAGPVPGMGVFWHHEIDGRYLKHFGGSHLFARTPENDGAYFSKLVASLPSLCTNTTVALAFLGAAITMGGSRSGMDGTYWQSCFTEES